MERQYRIILDAEASVARRVALGVIVKRPVKPLLQLIPGMFIIDFLRRTGKIRRFTRFYLPPRQQTLDAARALAGGEKKEAVLADLERKLQIWLDMQRLSGEAVLQALSALTGFLVEHYKRLLEADGEFYPSLVQAAYGSKAAYRAFLDGLYERERAYIQAISERFEGRESIQRQLIEEQIEAEEQRNKEIDGIF